MRLITMVMLLLTASAPVLAAGGGSAAGGARCSVVGCQLLAGVVIAARHPQPLVLASPDAVFRRGSESTLTGAVQQVDDNGVTIRSDLGAVHVVPWDRVRRVVTDNPDRDSMIARHMEHAAALWRARSRVERMDVTLAEPLFERLFEQYRGSTHETALVTAEGLLRCRLARGAHTLAIIPALEVMRLRRAGVRTESYAALPPVYDEAMGLCPALAPVWFESPALRRVEQELREYVAPGDEVTAAVAWLYAESVRRALGVADGPPPPGAWPEGEGVRLLIDLLACGEADSNRREKARDDLLRRESSLPGFARAWARFHVGWSLLRESGVVRQQRGMLSLLHVPAAHGSSQPYLAGIALSLVAGALEQSGSREPAAMLRGELDARFPFHPVRTARPAPVTAPPRT